MKNVNIHSVIPFFLISLFVLFLLVFVMITGFYLTFFQASVVCGIWGLSAFMCFTRF